MFDIAWSEIGVILVVALVVIGPKDIPLVVKTLRSYRGKMLQWKQEMSRVLDEVVEKTELTAAQDELKQEADRINRHIRYITDLEGRPQPAYDLSDLRPDLASKADDEKTTLH